MTKTFVTDALDKSKKLLAEINLKTSVTAMGQLKQRDTKLAAYFEKRLKEELYHIEAAVKNDKDQGWAIKSAELSELQKYRLQFAKALEKLIGKRVVLRPLS